MGLATEKLNLWLGARSIIELSIVNDEWRIVNKIVLSVYRAMLTPKAERKLEK